MQPEDPQPGLPALPLYVPRDHDRELGSVVRAAAEGRSRIAVLVGGSSTGKTRACWEALQQLREQEAGWRLWHPIDPSRPDAALRELPAIGPRTVVWLNEAQFYLDVVDGGRGERVAAGLRELLRDPARAPVLVLATLWPQFWDGLTAGPAADADPHAQARELLAGHDITVPTAFTAAQMARLGEAGDTRLAQAAEGAQDGQVIQFLAGAPQLLARYRNAPPAPTALINAAMDARRLGMGQAFPEAFLEAAAPGYLTDTEWDALDGDWLEQGLAYTAKPCTGVSGPLTRIHLRPARSRGIRPGNRDSDEQVASDPASIPGGPLYRLADYLDQYGRARRKGQFPPATFWAAAADHAVPADQATLGDAAHDRGLYRDAAQLHKNAAAHGNLRAVDYLSKPPHYLRADAGPVRWAVAHIPLKDPDAVAELLARLKEAGAQEQAAALLARDPAAHAALDNPHAVAGLLTTLRYVGAQEQAAALLARDPAAHAALDDPGAVAGLLATIREAGALEQAAALLARDPAAHAALDDPDAVGWLVGSLRDAGAQQQATALGDRAAANVALNDLRAVGRLVGSLRDAGAQQQAAALADRAAANVALDDPGGVADLLGSLLEAGAQEQAAVLADRAAANVALNDPYGITELVYQLQLAGAQEQATALADRAAHIALDDPIGMAELLGSLLEAGAQEQAAVLADRAAAGVALDDPGAVGRLLAILLKAGGQEQAAALLARDPASHVNLDDPFAVAFLLTWLPDAGGQEQAAALLARDPASHVDLENPYAVAALLGILREAGAQEQVAALLARDPASHVTLDKAIRVAQLLADLRAAGAQEQVTALAERAAAHAALYDSYPMGVLLGTLREVGAQQQAAALTDRLPGAGMFEFFREQGNRQDQFRFGREADGSPAGPWGWEDLD